MPDSPAPAVVAAARAGDPRALDHVLAFALPLVYNIVGRALRRHADVDDVVQETMLRVVRGLPELKDDAAFRSWLAAITIRQVRDNERERSRTESRRAGEGGGWVHEPADRDFAGETVLRLGLTDQRRDVAEATRWLDDDERELLSLWWLEESGQIERAGLAGALGLSAPHAAVRVHRMKKQLDTSRTVVQALRNECHSLRGTSRNWDGIPSPLWRKRFARHIRDCKVCTPRSERLLPLATLLASIPMVPPAFPLPHYVAPIHSGMHAGSLMGRAAGKASSHSALTPAGAAASHSIALPIAAVTAAVVAIAGGVTLLHPFGGTKSAAASQTPTISATTPNSSAAGVPSSSPSQTPSPSPTTSRTSKPVVTTTSKTVSVSDPKKGVCVWNAPSVSKALAASSASWYYTWSTSHSGVTTPAHANFVPMIWGASSVTTSALAQAKSSGDHLLGFNEPDMAAQSDMTPQQALNLWPQLESTGLVLGSPAVAYGGDTPGGWLDQFMSGAKAKGYRVDFIALHWYGGDFRTASAVSQLKSYLDAVYARYHKPIWLTEFALTDFSNGVRYPTASQQAAFVTAATKMLAGLPYLQRYAWFGLEADSTKPSTALFDMSGVANASGKAFMAAP
jgi:RNA polymerase sigma factor (sigma-70 family)